MSDIEDVFGGSAEEAKPEPAADSNANADAESKSSVVTERTEEVIPGETEKMVTETIDEDGDVVEETTEVTRKTVKRTMKITEATPRRRRKAEGKQILQLFDFGANYHKRF